MQVSFVIPVYNQVDHTRACLRSIEQHVGEQVDHEVILVDDGSDEATRSFLQDLDPAIRVVTLEKNSGFARATNSGARVAQATWLCLLNNDVELAAGAVAEMLSVADQHPRAGVIGNVQLYADSGEVDHAGIKFVDRGYPVHVRPPLNQLKARPDAQSAVAVTAACCLVNRAWFNRTGGLDDRYRNGFEDVDLCLRAREAGWQIMIANRSVVKHAVSASEGRGRFEYRNARKFLERWGPRSAALEVAEDKRLAEIFRFERAQTDSARESPVIQNARTQIRQNREATNARKREPVVVWVDLLRMEPGGANGGIKPLVYGLLKEMAALRWEPLRFIVLIQQALIEELKFLSDADVIAARVDGTWQTTQGNEIKHMNPEELARSYPAEVLYCPFGTSAFAQPDLPQVALLVDALHRDLPAALPIEEVNFREDNFKRIIAEADWIQTLANHGIERLSHHFGVHPTRCFHTYAAVQKSLTDESDATDDPAGIPPSPFFFYPANFWPHKNHEVLLAAYFRYVHQVEGTPWPLLLTGHADDRMNLLIEQRDALGLSEHVHFAGHLPNDAFRTVWQRAGALVFPSLHEGFGIPLVEAFEAGLPVIAAHASVLPEVGGDACAWIDPRDPRHIADTLAKVAQTPSLRDELIAQGKEQVKRFSLHLEASKLNHFLHAAGRRQVP